MADELDDRKTRTSLTQENLDLKGARLVIVTGTQVGKTFLLDKPLVQIGNLPLCDAVIEDDYASRRHCEIRLEPDGHHLIDLQSKNGTYVNGIRVREVRLSPGAILRVGRTTLFYQTQGPDDDSRLSDKDHFGSLQGQAKSMRQIYGLLEQIAPSDISVLIEGETGTGKDLLASNIHAKSPRASKPFIVVDCGAIAENLVESELFGHEKGSFTGAEQVRIGAFESAHGGTIFLDEIGELTLELQPKLLRVLEQREIRRVGTNKFIAVDVRVIAATNRDLEEEVAAKRFREDLFYRLAVVKVRLPALRERREDIPLLAERIIAEQTRIESITPEAMALLAQHKWPGNIRELRNVLQRALAIADGPTLHVKDLAMHLEKSLPLPSAFKGSTLEETERRAIVQALKEAGWNKAQAAKNLGIAVSTIYEKVKKYKIREDEEGAS